MHTPLTVNASEAVREALTRFGRTEDVRFSPDGSRLAFAGFGPDVVYLVDVVVADDGVEIGGLTEVVCATLHNPHGVCWLDDATVVVANRAGDVAVLAAPAPQRGVRRIEVDAVLTMRADEHGLNAPGSVAAVALAPDLFELLICNNDGNTVTRHVLDRRGGHHRVISSEVLLEWWLSIPDGIAVSNDRRWIAVSNHGTQSVLMFERTVDARHDSPTSGALHNVNYPHGLRFSGDDRHLIVADAGAPYIHVYARGAAWGGDRQPAATIRLMDDETYLHGRYNPQEGGPKGIDVHPSMSVIVVCSEHQPLAFFAAPALIPDFGQPTGAAPIGNEHTRVLLLRDAERVAALDASVRRLEADVVERDERISARDERIAAWDADITGLLGQVAGRDAWIADLEAAVADRDAALRQRDAAEVAQARAFADARAESSAQLQAMRDSASWQITAPLRALVGAWRRRR